MRVEDNYGRQMAGNPISGAGHVMQAVVLTVTGHPRCWGTCIDPGDAVLMHHCVN